MENDERQLPIGSELENQDLPHHKEQLDSPEAGSADIIRQRANTDSPNNNKDKDPDKTLGILAGRQRAERQSPEAPDYQYTRNLHTLFEPIRGSYRDIERDKAEAHAVEIMELSLTQLAYPDKRNEIRKSQEAQEKIVPALALVAGEMAFRNPNVPRGEEYVPDVIRYNQANTIFMESGQKLWPDMQPSEEALNQIRTTAQDESVAGRFIASGAARINLEHTDQITDPRQLINSIDLTLAHMGDSLSDIAITTSADRTLTDTDRQKLLAITKNMYGLKLYRDSLEKKITDIQSTQAISGTALAGITRNPDGTPNLKHAARLIPETEETHEEEPEAVRQARERLQEQHNGAIRELTNKMQTYGLSFSDIQQHAELFGIDPRDTSLLNTLDLALQGKMTVSTERNIQYRDRLLANIPEDTGALTARAAVHRLAEVVAVNELASQYLHNLGRHSLAEAIRLDQEKIEAAGGLKSKTMVNIGGLQLNAYEADIMLNALENLLP